MAVDDWDNPVYSSIYVWHALWYVLIGVTLAVMAKDTMELDDIIKQKEELTGDMSWQERDKKYYFEQTKENGKIKVKMIEKNQYMLDQEKKEGQENKK